MKKYISTLISSNVLFGVLSGAFLVGCQVHKPVPVEHLKNPSSAAAYDARNVKGSTIRRSQVTTDVFNTPLASTQWTPIEIQPLQTAEPTQPLTHYTFKPHPAQAKKTAKAKPVESTPKYASASDFHIVRRGESLYGIARQYGLSAKTLAGYNSLRPPYEIYPQQKLLIGSAKSVSRGAAANTIARSPQKVATPAKAITAVQWAWPASGKLIEGFSAGVSNGIEIAGNAGGTVRASADGTVLYSGNEVTGYGELVILEHAQGYMTTYAHNRKLLVKQGQAVKRGQKIAEMGSTEAERTKLHFEIRKGEKPVNPLAYLPKR